MRVTVVGAGIMGLSTAWALKRQGHFVTVVEQYDVPNPLGSSVDQHRLIRHTYGAKAGYAAMVDAAYPAWDRVWTDLGRSLFVQTGTLCVGQAGQGWIQDSADVLAKTDIDHEWLDRESMEKRFPLIHVRDDDRAFWLPSGGVLLANSIIEGLARYLAAHSVPIRTKSRATAIDPNRATVRLADGRAIEADRLVVAAGPWVGRLLTGMERRVTPSRQLVAYVEPPADQTLAWSRMPMVLDIDPAFGFYLVPPVGVTRMKVGDHSFTLTGDPDQDREATEEEAKTLLEGCQGRLTGFDRFRRGPVKTCFYTVEPEERFIVEPVGDAAWVMTGFSGHGFKFGPLLGEAMVEALTGERLPSALGRWAAGHQD